MPMKERAANCGFTSMKSSRADAAPDIARHHVIKLHHLPFEEQHGQFVPFQCAEEQQPREAGVLVELAQDQPGQFGQKPPVVIALEMQVHAGGSFHAFAGFGFDDGGVIPEPIAL